MTQHPHPENNYPSDVADEKPERMTVRSIGDLLAAVPALLGFTPERSLVLMCMTSGPSSIVEVSMRQTLPMRAEAGMLVDTAIRCAEVCGREGLDAVIAVLVTGSRRSRSDEEIADMLCEVFEVRGIELSGAYQMANMRAGERWISLGADRLNGIMTDPSASAVAASRVANGQQIRGTRGDVEALLDLDTVDSARFEKTRDVVYPELDDWSSADLLGAVVGDLIAIHDQGELDDIVAARILYTVGIREVRDGIMGLADTYLADTAEQVWVHLTRRVSGVERADAAMMVAIWAYFRGEGPLAGVALDIVLDEHPAHRMGMLFDTALQNGVRPDMVRELVFSAHGLAADLGVELPPSLRR